jgi:hypothetical protein
VTGYGPPDDPSEAPTGQYDYGDYGQPQPDTGSTPWYRKPAALIGLAALAAILIALVIFGIVELTHGGSSTSPSTSSTTRSAVTTTPPTTTSLPSSETTTEPVAPAPSTTLTSPPTSTSTDDGHHHHHHQYGDLP